MLAGVHGANTAIGSGKTHSVFFSVAWLPLRDFWEAAKSLFLYVRFSVVSHS